MRTAIAVVLAMLAVAILLAGLAAAVFAIYQLIRDRSPRLPLIGDLVCGVAFLMVGCGALIATPAPGGRREGQRSAGRRDPKTLVGP